jgi:hypothetical protein
VRARTWRVGLVVALAFSLGTMTARPAFAHGGPIGLTALANSPAGPLQSFLRVHAVWLGDGDDADGLTISVQGSGPGTISSGLSGNSGVYQATLSYPAAGTWTLTVSVVGAPYDYSATPLVVSVVVEAPTAPPTTAAPTPTAAPAPGGETSPTGTPSTAEVPPTTGPPAATGGPEGTAVPAGAAPDALGPAIVVVPKTVPNGSYSMVSLAVPNVRSSTDVVAVEAQFPARRPLLSAQVRAMPGWSAAVAIAKLAVPRGNITERVGSVTWTATDPLGPGEFEQYIVSIGPLPKKARSMWIDVVQTYSDGQRVTWSARPTRQDPDPDLASARIRLRKLAVAGGAPGSHS